MSDGYTFIAYRPDFIVETHILPCHCYPYLPPPPPHMMRGVKHTPAVSQNCFGASPYIVLSFSSPPLLHTLILLPHHILYLTLYSFFFITFSPHTLFLRSHYLLSPHSILSSPLPTLPTLYSFFPITSPFYFTLLCSKSNGSTTNEYRDEASFHQSMSKQDRRSESSDEARPCYDQKHDINQRTVTLRQQSPANRPIQGGCNALRHGVSTKRFQSQHLHKNSHHLQKLTYSQQQSNGSRNQLSCLRTGWADVRNEEPITNIIFKCLNTNS
ncbi:hypothetical protein FHG87_023100 [Trinorchestia longiramus]|nr:hypothetical protein FHG87_023100 [Trinorchestia longiramus]